MTDYMHASLSSYDLSTITSIPTTITPDMASKWLDPSVNSGNRPLYDKIVKEYIGYMLNGWRANGTTITFDTSGTLVDGQHRLKACVEASTSFDAIVVRGVPVGSFTTIDVGKARTVSDSLKAAHVTPQDLKKSEASKFVAISGPAARLILGYKSYGSLGYKGRISNADILGFYEDAKADLDICIMSAMDNVRTMAPHVFAGLMYLAKSETNGTEMFERFLEDIKVAVSGHKKYRVDHPVARIKSMFGTGGIRRDDLGWKLALAWNVYNNDETLKPLSDLKGTAATVRVSECNSCEPREVLEEPPIVVDPDAPTATSDEPKKAPRNRKPKITSGLDVAWSEPLTVSEA